MKRSIHTPSAVVSGVFLLLTGISAHAQELAPIPKESGFSGFVNAGAMFAEFESNMVAGGDFGDAGKSTINSITDSPKSESDVWPVLNLDIRYTFASTRTQLFIGNRIEDFVRLDFTNQAGVRQGFADGSSVSVAGLFTTFPTEVWADPYVAGVPRSKTDRKNTGVRLEWQRIFGSGFTTTYNYRKVKIDRELSGTTQLGLTPAQAQLLRREGDVHEVEGRYAWKLGERDSLVPAVRLGKRDLDGKAMANDRGELQLTWIRKGERFSMSGNAGIGRADYDSTNPIYLRKREDDFYGVSGQFFWHAPFGAPKELSALFSFGYLREDSNINFYDAQVVFGGLSAFYTF